MDALRTTNILLSVIVTILVVAVLKVAELVFVTILVAVLLAYILEIAVRFLRNLTFPNWVAILLVALVSAGAIVVLFIQLYQSVRELATQLPAYQTRLMLMIAGVNERLAGLLPGSVPIELTNFFDGASVSRYLLDLTQSIASSFAEFLIIYLFAVLMVFGKYHLPIKLIRAFPGRSQRRVPALLLQIDREVRKYIGVKTLSSTFVGAFIAVTCSLFGVEFAVLWGFVGFICNYIPHLGPFVSSSLPAIVAAVLFRDTGRALWLFGLLLGVQLVLHQFIEPKVQGEVLRLSFFVVLVSLFIWGWMWGPLGVLLAIPVTASLKIILTDIPVTAPIGVLMEKPIRRRLRRGK